MKKQIRVWNRVDVSSVTKCAGHVFDRKKPSMKGNDFALRSLQHPSHEILSMAVRESDRRFPRAEPTKVLMTPL